MSVQKEYILAMTINEKIENIIKSVSDKKIKKELYELQSYAMYLEDTIKVKHNIEIEDMIRDSEKGVK